jgi:hypothetical protein
LAYCGWGISGIEVTDDYLAAWRGQRRQKLIKWNEVRSVRRTHGGIAVRGGDATIRFSYLIEDYGRLTNLVLTRAAVTGR